MYGHGLTTPSPLFFFPFVTLHTNNIKLQPTNQQLSPSTSIHPFPSITTGAANTLYARTLRLLCARAGRAVRAVPCRPVATLCCSARTAAAATVSSPWFVELSWFSLFLFCSFGLRFFVCCFVFSPARPVVFFCVALVLLARRLFPFPVVLFLCVCPPLYLLSSLPFPACRLSSVWLSCHRFVSFPLFIFFPLLPPPSAFACCRSPPPLMFVCFVAVSFAFSFCS